MWAVVEISKKQYLVKEGEIIKVERLPDVKGEVTFDKVLLVANDSKVSVGKPYVGSASVKAAVQGEEKGDKVLSYKYRRRKKSRRIHGHRQIHTILKIANIVA